jgi:hypothetical protein
MSGNPSYGILDRVPYIDVLQCLEQRVGDGKTRGRLWTRRAKFKIRFMLVKYDRRSYPSVYSGSGP